MEGECPVGQLAERVGLSQSALSQHLNRLRQDGLVDTRRDGQTIYYRLADSRVEVLIRLLYDQFCKDHCLVKPDRQSVVEGKSVTVRFDLGGRRINKKKK